MGAKPPCCPQGLGWYRAIARFQPSIIYRDYEVTRDRSQCVTRYVLSAAGVWPVSAVPSVSMQISPAPDVSLDLDCVARVFTSHSSPHCDCVLGLCKWPVQWQDGAVCCGDSRIYFLWVSPLYNCNWDPCILSGDAMMMAQYHWCPPCRGCGWWLVPAVCCGAYLANVAARLCTPGLVHTRHQDTRLQILGTY